MILMNRYQQMLRQFIMHCDTIRVDIGELHLQGLAPEEAKVNKDKVCPFSNMLFDAPLPLLSPWVSANSCVLLSAGGPDRPAGGAQECDGSGQMSWHASVGKWFSHRAPQSAESAEILAIARLGRRAFQSSRASVSGRFSHHKPRSAGVLVTVRLSQQTF